MQIIPDLIPTIVLTVPFLVTLVALHVIFFKPLFDYMEEREGISSKARREAEDFHKAAGETLDAVEARLLDARRSAGETRAKARAVAQAEEAGIISAARKDAEQKVEAAVGEIKRESATAAATLKTTAKALSSEIAQQVLGRTLAS